MSLKTKKYRTNEGQYVFGIYKAVNYHTWSYTAKECYKRGCNCEGCPIKDLYFQDSSKGCQMKKSVVSLVLKFGIPKDLIKKESEIIIT